MDHPLTNFNVDFHEARLKNGVKAFLFSRKGMPIFMRASFFAGSRFDQIPGTAHFAEHMLVAGTRRFPQKNKLAEHIESVGGHFSASTGTNILRVEVNIPQAQDLNTGFEVMEEILFNPLFDENTIELERRAIDIEIDKRDSSPQTRITEVYKNIFFQGTPAANSVLGNKDDLKRISKNELLSFYEKFITQERMVLIVSGDIGIDELVSKADKYLNKKSLNLINNPKTFLQPLPITRGRTFDHQAFGDSEQTNFIIGTRTVPFNHPDTPVLNVIASILGSGRSSRLITKLRYEKGLVYSIDATNHSGPDYGAMTFSGSTRSQNKSDVIKITIAEVKKIVEGDVEPSEIKAVVSKIVKSQFNKMQTSQSWINIHEQELLFSEKPRTLGDYLENLYSIDKERIVLIAKKYLNKEDFFYTACGGTE